MHPVTLGVMPFSMATLTAGRPQNDGPWSAWSPCISGFTYMAVVGIYVKFVGCNQYAIQYALTPSYSHFSIIPIAQDFCTSTLAMSLRELMEQAKRHKRLLNDCLATQSCSTEPDWDKHRVQTVRIRDNMR